MRAVEFEGTVTSEGNIALPPQIAGEIPSGEQLRIVVMWDEPDLDLAWHDLARQRFEEAYSPDDAVYELLNDDAAAR